MAVLGRGGGDTHPHASVATHANADADAEFDAVESESEYDPVRAALEFPGIASFTEVSLYKPPLGLSARPPAVPDGLQNKQTKTKQIMQWHIVCWCLALSLYHHTSRTQRFWLRVYVCIARTITRNLQF